MTSLRPALAAVAATAMTVTLLPAASAAPWAAPTASAAPRVSTQAGAVNPIARPTTSTVRVTATGTGVARLSGLDPSAGGALVQVSVDTRQSATVQIGPTAKGPFTTVVVTSGTGTWSGTALVATTGQVFVKSSAAATARVSALAWVADAEAGVQLGSGALGIAVPVTRVDTTQKGFGDGWLTGGRDVQLTGLGGIPPNGASAILASVTLRSTREAVSLTYSLGSASGTAVSATSGATVAALAMLPVDVRGQVKLRTSAAARVTVTPVGWVSRGRYDTGPLLDGAVRPIAPQSFVNGAFPARRSLAATSVPAQAGAVQLIAVQASGTGKVSAGSSTVAMAQGTATALLPASTTLARPNLVSTGRLTGSAAAVGWVVAGSLNDSVQPKVSVNGAPDLTVDLKGDGQFLLSGSASDASGVCRVMVEVPDGDEGSAYAYVDPLSGTWSLPYAPPAGLTDILVTAYDCDGNATESQVVADVTAADINETLVAPNVVELTGTQRESIEAFTEGTITFTSPTVPVSPGDIISVQPGGKAPDGALRHVLAVAPRGTGGWTVYTLQAEPTDALLQINLGVTDEVLDGIGDDPVEPVSRGKVPRDFTIGDEERLNYNFTREARDEWKSEGGAVKGNGKIKGTTYGALIFRMQIFIETCLLVPCGGRVDLFQIRFENTTRVDAEVHSKVGKDKKVIEDWPLASPIDTGWFMAGPVPISTSLQPRGYVDLEAELDITAWAQKVLNFELTYQHSTGWQTPVADIYQPIEWRTDINFEGRAEAGIKLTEAIKVAGVAGPSFVVKLGLLGVEGKASVTVGSMFADPVCDVSIRVYSVIGLGLGFVVGVGDDPWAVDFFPIEVPIDWYTWPKDDLCPGGPVGWLGSILELAGRGVGVSDVSQRGDPLSVVDIDYGGLSGVLMSTGNARAIFDEELVDREFEALGSYDIDRLFDVKSTDASSTGFTIEPEGSVLEIPYRLLSQEYASEDLDRDSRDAVAILIDGINCAETEEGEPVNSSTVPPDSEMTEELRDLPFDGISDELLCRLKVKPRVPIRVEIVVADVGKDGIDTAIYLPWGGIRVR